MLMGGWAAVVGIRLRVQTVGYGVAPKYYVRSVTRGLAMNAVFAKRTRICAAHSVDCDFVVGHFAVAERLLGEQDPADQARRSNGVNIVNIMNIAEGDRYID